MTCIRLSIRLSPRVASALCFELLENNSAFKYRWFHHDSTCAPFDQASQHAHDGGGHAHGGDVVSANATAVDELGAAATLESWDGSSGHADANTIRIVYWLMHVLAAVVLLVGMVVFW